MQNGHTCLIQQTLLPFHAGKLDSSIKSHGVWACAVCIKTTNMDATKEQNVQNKQLQLDFRPHNMTTTTYIQLEFYWHPVHLKFRVLLGFLLYTSSGIQLQGA